MKKPKVFIIDGCGMYTGMFVQQGWEVVDRIKDADLVQFTGGQDVSPRMYGELPHKYTHSSPERDAYEAAVFNVALAQKKPMAGICRGGQFLNVMSGGSMWQHVDNHCVHKHDARDHLTNSMVMVTSTHHQMMKPSVQAEIFMTARCATTKERMGNSGGVIIQNSDEPDVECCYYEATDALCYQPHPEFPRPDMLACREAYFNYIEHTFALMGVK